jgi:hypothetical protein
MIVLYNLESDRAKFLTILTSILAFATILAIASGARKVEIFAATAA